MKGGNLINGRLLSKAFHLLLRLTGKNHALLQTFLETAKLTSVTLSFVNLTIAVRNATVNPLVLNSTFEESFASAIEKGTYNQATIPVKIDKISTYYGNK